MTTVDLLIVIVGQAIWQTPFQFCYLLCQAASLHSATDHTEDAFRVLEYG